MGVGGLHEETQGGEEEIEACGGARLGAGAGIGHRSKGSGCQKYRRGDRNKGQFKMTGARDWGKIGAKRGRAFSPGLNIPVLSSK